MKIHLFPAIFAVLPLLAEGDSFNYPADADLGNISQNRSQIQVFEVGEQQQFLWTTSAAGVRLALWQEGAPGTEEILDKNNTEESFTWGGRPAQDLRNGIMFFLQIYDASNPIGVGGPLAQSCYFNFTDPSKSSSTTTASTTTATVTSSSFTSSIPSTPDVSAKDSSPAKSSTSPTAHSTVVPSTSGGTGGKKAIGLGVGLGVGLGIGLSLLILAGTFWIRKHRRGKAANAPVHDEAEYKHDTTNNTASTPHPPTELSGDTNGKSVMVELPGSSTDRATSSSF